MKTITIIALTLGMFAQSHAVEKMTTNVPAPFLSKEEITTILDIKTKQHIDLELTTIAPLVAPKELILIARQDRPARAKVIPAKTLGDE